MESFGTHLLAFLGGTAIGAAGTYFAEKFTDRRREKERSSAERATFAKLTRLMPALVQELRTDVRQDETRAIRELVQLPSRGVMFTSSKPRFAYYESEHPNLAEDLLKLADAGYLTDVTPGETPIYRMTEAFHEMLRGDA